MRDAQNRSDDLTVKAGCANDILRVNGDQNLTLLNECLNGGYRKVLHYTVYHRNWIILCVAYSDSCLDEGA